MLLVLIKALCSEHIILKKCVIYLLSAHSLSIFCFVRGHEFKLSCLVLLCYNTPYRGILEVL